MNNRSLSIDALQELYVLSVASLLRHYGALGIEPSFSRSDIWTNAMCPLFPEGLEPEDIVSFIEREEADIQHIVEIAMERLSGGTNVIFDTDTPVGGPPL